MNICGAKENGAKAHKDERLLPFFMGLNNTFIWGWRNIYLSIFPFLLLSRLILLLFKMKNYGTFIPLLKNLGESIFFRAANNGERRFKDYKTQHENPIKKNSLLCNYCKNIGHDINH